MRAPRSQRVTVRLTGIPPRYQGTHDSLCAYYAAAMLLCALRPEFDDQFDASHVSRDPIFANLPRRRGQKIDRLVSDWVASGVRLDRVTRALNTACANKGVRTQFGFRTGNRVRGQIEFLKRQIDRGLPCVLGWESREMGNHTVLVVGYECHGHGLKGGQWLKVNDPSHVQTLLEWDQLERLADRRLEVIWCGTHEGVRPDKVVTHRGKNGILTGLTEVARWEPSSEQYVRLGL